MTDRVDFDRCIDSYLLRGQLADDGHPREVGVYYPSELSYPCLRNLYLRYKYPDKGFPADALRVFKLGSLIHEFIQEAFLQEQDAFSVRGIEKSVTYQAGYEGWRFELRGRVDAIVEKEGREYAVELKSCSPYAFQHFLPKFEHRLQLMFYLSQLNLRKGFIVYIEKSKMKTQIYPLEYEPELANELYKRALKLHTALKRGKIPNKESDHWGGKICRYCHLKCECSQHYKDLFKH